jgi:hypothetical protein
VSGRFGPLLHSCAWLIIGAATSILGAFESPVVDAIGVPAAVLGYLLVGIGLGWLWNRLYPRPLIERAQFTIALSIAVGTLALIFWLAELLGAAGSDINFAAPTPRTASILGIVGALVVADRFRISRARQETSARVT